MQSKSEEVGRLMDFLRNNCTTEAFRLYQTDVIGLGLSENRITELLDDLIREDVLGGYRLAYAKLGPTAAPAATSVFPATDEYCIPFFYMENVNLAKLLAADFDDSQAKIAIGRVSITLPPYRNEHYLCRVMFSKPAGEWIDWSLVYEEMTGNKAGALKTKRRSVYDAMAAVNKRVKGEVGTPLLQMNEKAMRRLF